MLLDVQVLPAETVFLEALARLELQVLLEGLGRRERVVQRVPLVETVLRVPLEETA